MKPGPAEAPPRSRSARFTIEDAGHGSFGLRFSGAFRLGWLGRLGAALSRRGVNVTEGRAEKGSDGHWNGSLRFESSGRHEFSEFDWEALCEEEVVGPAEVPLRITHFSLRQRTKRSLELSVQAYDDLGFLSGLLRRLGFLGLFPEQIDVRTTHGVVDDSFVLSGLGGEISDTVEQALFASLQRLVTSNSTSPPRAAHGSSPTPASAPVPGSTPAQAPGSSPGASRTLPRAPKR